MQLIKGNNFYVHAKRCCKLRAIKTFVTNNAVRSALYKLSCREALDEQSFARRPPSIFTPTTSMSSTYDHRILRIRLPVRSAIYKQDTGGLVLGWVTTGESPLLYVFGLFLHWMAKRRLYVFATWTIFLLFVCEPCLRASRGTCDWVITTRQCLLCRVGSVGGELSTSIPWAGRNA